MGSSRHLALLRGINVGGKNSLPMATLKELFEKAGCTDVATYIQSGNVVFSASAKTLTGLDLKVKKLIAAKAGLDVPVVLRSAAELALAAKANPWLKQGAAEDALHLMFLADVPAGEAVKQLDPNRSPGDRFVASGRDIYLHCPNGLGNSKLTNAWFDAKLKTVSTCRNWRTVNKLLELSG